MRLKNEVIYKKVREYMEKEKIFLDPNLTLAHFALIVVPTIYHFLK